MSALFTRPQLRDRLRRKLQILVPADTVPPSGMPGDAPTWDPLPTNQQLNDCITDALAVINTYCEPHVTQTQVTVVGQTQNGPLGVYLGTGASLNNPGVQFTPNPIGWVIDVKSASWVDSTGLSTLLSPVDRDYLDRGGQPSNYQNMPPAIPTYYYVEGYVLYLIPAPASAGTVKMVCGTGFVGLQDDTNPLDQIPDDYQPVFEYEALTILEATQGINAEAQAWLAYFAPTSERLKEELKAWRKGATGPTETGFALRSYRTSYQTMKQRN